MLGATESELTRNGSAASGSAARRTGNKRSIAAINLLTHSLKIWSWREFRFYIDAGTQSFGAWIFTFRAQLIITLCTLGVL